MQWTVVACAPSHLRCSNSVPETLPGFSSSDSDEPSHPEGTSFSGARIPAVPPVVYRNGGVGTKGSASVASMRNSKSFEGGMPPSKAFGLLVLRSCRNIALPVSPSHLTVLMLLPRTSHLRCSNSVPMERRSYRCSSSVPLERRTLRPVALPNGDTKWESVSGTLWRELFIRYLPSLSRLYHCMQVTTQHDLTRHFEVNSG